MIDERRLVRFKHVGIKPTPEQHKALHQLAARWRGVDVFHGSLDLPDGYLLITLDPEGQPVYGGMSPQGEVST